MPKLFLGHPVTDFQGSDGSYRPEKKAVLEKIITALVEMKYDVTCAALNEEYGRIKLDPEEFTRYDIESIKNCDLFILYTSERLTSDMYLEIGIAYGYDKSIMLVVPPSAYRRYLTFMILGLEKLGKIQIIVYESENEIPTLLAEKLKGINL